MTAKRPHGQDLGMELFNENCLSVFKKIPPGSVDLVLTDPPYGITEARWDAVIPLKPMWTGIERVLNKKSGMVLLFGKNPFTAKLISSNFKKFSYDLVWEKTRLTNPFSFRKRPMGKHEIISVFKYGKTKFFPQSFFKKGKKKGSKVKVGGSGRKEKKIASNEHDCYDVHRSKGLRPATQGFHSDILRFASANGGIHATEKPTALLAHLIRSYSAEGETVLDFTMGSGSTGVACLMTGRKFIGCELDDSIFRKAKRRCELYQKQMSEMGKA